LKKAPLESGSMKVAIRWETGVLSLMGGKCHMKSESEPLTLKRRMSCIRVVSGSLKTR
jgi:hypothetical protein